MLARKFAENLIAKSSVEVATTTRSYPPINAWFLTLMTSHSRATTNVQFSSSSPPQLEAVFLSLINYSTVIGRKQFAKYYYALLDVAPPSPGAPTCSFKRRAAATLGYGP